MARSVRAGLLLVAAAVTSFTASTAARADLFYVDGSIRYQYYPSAIPPTVLDSYQRDLNVPVGDGAHFDVVDVKDQHAEADSLAEQFGLHAHTYVEIIHQISQPASPFGDPMNIVAYANARVTFTDMIIAGPGAATTVQTPLNFHIKGAQGLSYYVPSFGLSNSVCTTQMLVQVPGDSDSGYVTLQSYMGAAPVVTSRYMLANFLGNGEMNVTTNNFTLPVNTPFSVTVYLNLSSDVSVDFTDSFIAGANNDFSGTLTFATDRPVFTLPAGYTANSAQAGIINNQFAVPVPEAGTLGVLLLGVLGLTPRRRQVASRN